jgi:hypothetical protein
VTLVAALFAIAAKDANKKYVVVAYIPVLVFWIIDAYFLSQERLFRSLYDSVRQKREEDIDFSMSTKAFQNSQSSWPASFFSRTLVLFYLSMTGMMLLVMYSIR